MLKRFGWVILLFVLCIQLSGCAPAVFVVGGAAGAGAVVWVKGKLEEELNLPLSKVHQASLAALQELELPVQADRKDMLAAEIRSEFADGKDIWIDIRSLTESSTKITIRVGMFGDQSRSERILETVHRHL
jgi:hypothetical protein